VSLTATPTATGQAMQWIYFLPFVQADELAPEVSFWIYDRR